MKCKRPATKSVHQPQPAVVRPEVGGIRRLLTPEDVADLLSSTRQAVIKKARLGTIPSFKLGKAVRFYPAAIDAWLRQQAGQ